MRDPGVPRLPYRQSPHMRIKQLRNTERWGTTKAFAPEAVVGALLGLEGTGNGGG